MADSGLPAAPDLSILKLAAGRRRAARKELRDLSADVAQQMLRVLRVGDRAFVLPGGPEGAEVTYEIIKVTWRARLREWDHEDGETPERISPFARPCLVRSVGERRAAILDPRITWTDQDDDHWVAVGRDLTPVDDEGEPDGSPTVWLATDEELMAYCREAPDAAVGFVAAIERESERLALHADALRSFGGDQ